MTRTRPYEMPSPYGRGDTIRGKHPFSHKNNVGTFGIDIRDDKMSQSIEIIEKGTYWTLTVSGWIVDRCVIDAAFMLEFLHEANTLSIRIEGDFELKPLSTKRILSPTQPESLGEALILMRKTLLSIEIYKSGTLDLQFSDGINLTVNPHKDYETWEIIGSNGLRILCMPDGDIAIWTPS